MRGDRRGSFSLIGAAGALVAVACCAGLPLLATSLGGLTIAAVVGVAGGVLLAVAALTVVVLLLRAGRRRACAATERVTR